MHINKITQANHGIITITLVSLLSLLLTACDNDQDTVATETKPQQETSIILSPDGIGPINSTTSFNMHKMTVAFSEYNVVEEVTFREAKPFPAIRISEGVNTVLNIIPDASKQGIYSVIIEDNIIKNSLGHPLGTLYNEVYSYGQNEQCQPGVEDFDKKLLCYAPQHPNILYVFNGAWDAVVTGKAPPADILQGWALESIIWRPKN